MYRPKCLDCGNTTRFREYELVSYLVTYDESGKESELECYSDLPDELYPTECLHCNSQNVEYTFHD